MNEEVLLPFLDFLGRKYINESHLYTESILGAEYGFYDGVFSRTVNLVAAEINRGEYVWKDIEFRPNDIVIDIGANVGIVSIVLAKIYPYITVYAFEPDPINYSNFLRNIDANKIPIGRIVAINAAVTGDGRDISMQHISYNSGASNMFGRTIGNHTSNASIVESKTLDDIFENNSINQCKLLKMDCEGAEYEIIQNTKVETLGKIEHFRGELHEWDEMTVTGTAIIEYLEKYISDVIVTVNRDQLENNGGLKEVHRRMTQENADIHKCIDQMDEHVVDAHKNADNAHKRIDQTDGRVAEAHKNADNAHKRIDQTDGRVAEAHKNADNAHKRIDQVNVRVDEANKRIDQTDGRVAEVHKNADNAHERIDQVNVRVDEVSRHINQIDGRVTDAHKNADNAHKRIDQTDGRVAEAHKNADNAHERIGQVNVRVDEANKRIDQTDGRVAEAHKNADNAHKRIDQVNARVDEASKRIDELRNEADEFQKRVFDMIEEHNQSINLRIDELRDATFFSKIKKIFCKIIKKS